MFKPCLPHAYKLKCRAISRLCCNFIVLIVFFFSSFVHSATQKQLDTIRQLAEEYTISSIKPPEGAIVEANAASLDNRIQASDCPTGLSAFSSSKNGSVSNITVLIKCEVENWRVYVPVKLTTQIPAAVALIPLSRGQVISSSQVATNMVNVLRLRQQGYLSTSQIIGAKVKRNIKLGDIIDSNDICVVCRNETVVIKAIKNGMVITTRGTALSDGNFGQQIKIKNSKSKRIIDAQVSGIGEATVRF
ncbi:flagellar basal body P-ring formation chaperone FlgA [Vibrio sp. RC27]